MPPTLGLSGTLGASGMNEEPIGRMKCPRYSKNWQGRRRIDLWILLHKVRRTLHVFSL